MCTASHAITLYLLKLLLTMSTMYSPMRPSTQTRNASSGALHLCTASHAITLCSLKVSVTMSRIYSPMCLSTQGRNASSGALHLCTAWHAITLYLLRFSVIMSRIYSPMCLSTVSLAHWLFYFVQGLSFACVSRWSCHSKFCESRTTSSLWKLHRGWMVRVEGDSRLQTQQGR